MTPLYRRINSQACLGFVWCTLGLALAGCSTPSETFDCQPGKGVDCKSISEVNQMVDQGTVGNSVEKDMQPTFSPFSVPVISSNSLSVDNAALNNVPHSTDIPLSETLWVRRIPEHPIRVWIAPYQDAQGNFHEGSLIHTVFKPGFWQIFPATSPGDNPSGRDASNPEEDA